MGPVLKDLGFERRYEVEINPEYPRDGNWRVPHVHFGDKGRDALTLRLRPERGQEWVATFALEDRGLLTGVYACPNPEQVMVATGRAAFLLDSAETSAADELPVHPIKVVARPRGTDLLAIGSFTDLVVVDGSGVRWARSGLFLDELDLVDGPPDVVRAVGRTAYAQTERTVVDLDITTGRSLSSHR